MAYLLSPLMLKNRFWWKLFLNITKFFFEFRPIFFQISRTKFLSTLTHLIQLILSSNYSLYKFILLYFLIFWYRHLMALESNIAKKWKNVFLTIFHDFQRFHKFSRDIQRCHKFRPKILIETRQGSVKNFGFHQCWESMC